MTKENSDTFWGASRPELSEDFELSDWGTDAELRVCRGQDVENVVLFDLRMKWNKEIARRQKTWESRV